MGEETALWIAGTGRQPVETPGWSWGLGMGLSLGISCILAAVGELRFRMPSVLLAAQSFLGPIDSLGIRVEGVKQEFMGCLGGGVYFLVLLMEAEKEPGVAGVI